MNKKKQFTSEEKLDKILAEVKRIGKIEKRIEEIVVDSNEIRFDVVRLKAYAQSLSKDVSLAKHDLELVKEGGEKTRKELSKKIDNLAREIRGLIDMNAHLYANAVSQKELNQLDQRVTILEQL